MPSVLFLHLWLVWWMEVAACSTGDDLVDQLQEIPTVSNQSTNASVSVNFYPRQQLVLGPALNVTVREGDKALMPCITPHLGDRTVSWIRQKDLAILVSGHHVYTSDSRVESIHPSSSDLWGLQISPVRSSDEGFYQCQVNSEPKQSKTIVLIVLDQDLKDSPSVTNYVETTPTTVKVAKMISLKIAGGQERNVLEGNDVVLFCSITIHEEGLYGKNIELAWWHRNLKLSSKVSGTRVSSTQIVGTTEVSVELVFAPVHHMDAGTYYCKAEPKYFQRQTLKPYILKESFVKLNVARRHSTNSGLENTPLSFYFVMILCCTVYGM